MLCLNIIITAHNCKIEFPFPFPTLLIRKVRLKLGVPRPLDLMAKLKKEKYVCRGAIGTRRKITNF